jgi:hypothetical protein
MADAKIVHSAIARAVYNILKNPADYTRYADGRPIFPVEECDGTPTLKDGVLDAGYLASFGSLLVPVNVWRAMQRFGTWIEPSIVAEWIKLMKGYAATRRDELSETAIAKAMTWEEIDRDVDVARGRALELMANQPIYCVWTGAKLDAKTLAMDHAFPWSAWPCGDLWNLFPSRNHANQNKSDKLPSDRLLVDRRDAIQSWWRDGYEKRDDLAPKFLSEARTSLPGLVADDGALGMDDVFAGMRFQRLRLWRDQQIPEWDGR